MESIPKGWVEMLREWGHAVKNLPQILRVCAFKTRTIDDELTEATLKGSLRRALEGWDLLALGLGFVMGSGVFVLTGINTYIAGPAIVLSYLLSGISATLAASCYAEFAVEYPVAGQGFTYIMLTFGELPAWIAVTNLLMEYILGTAATARGFSIYLSRLIWEQTTSDLDKRADDERFLVGDFDFMAFGITLLLTAVLAVGVRESALLISFLVAIHMLLLVTIIIAGFTQASGMSSPFLRGGLDNMLTAGAHVFFAYAGFDVVASASEEARKPEAVPRSIIATTVIATVSYVLMSLFLVLMVPIALIDANQATAFSSAFLAIGFNGMYYVTNLAALVGIVTSMLVGLFGVARIIIAAARDWLFPPFLATIYPRTQTPLVAQVAAGVVIALVALFATFTTLSDLVSLSTALVMILVANALLFRRYYPGLPRLRFSKWGTVESAESQTVMPFAVPGSRLNLSLSVRQWLVIGHLVGINAFPIGLTVYYQLQTQILVWQPQVPGSSAAVDPLGDSISSQSKWLGVPIMLGFWLATTLSLQLLCPLEYEPPKWHIPWWLMPWLPSVTILCMIFTAGALNNQRAYIIFLYFFPSTLVAYLLFALPMSYIKHYKLDYVNTEQMTVVQLSFRDGRWQDPRGIGKASGELSGLAPTLVSANLVEAKMRQARQMQQWVSGPAWRSGSKRGPSVASSGRLPKEIELSLQLAEPGGSVGSQVGLPSRPPRPLSPAKPGRGQRRAPDQPRELG